MDGLEILRLLLAQSLGTFFSRSFSAVYKEIKTVTDALQLESASLSVTPEAVSSFDTWCLSMAGSH